MLYFSKTCILALIVLVQSSSVECKASDPIASAATDLRGQVLIQIEGELVYQHAFGAVDPREETPIDPQTLFYIGSIAKTFTSTLILQLVDEEKILLDGSISEYIQSVPDDKEGITIRNLLSHTSGLIANHDNPLAQLDRTMFLEWALSTQLESEPGMQWSYSNIGYSLLAAIIELVEKKPFREVVHERIFEPAGMNRAVYISELEGDEQIAIGRGPMAEEFNFDGNFRELPKTWLRMGAGGVLCTSDDLAAFHRALQSEALLSLELQKLAATPVANRYGLGWRTATSSMGTPTMYHDGSFPGFNAEFFRMPIEDVCIVILAADEQGAHEMRNTVLEYAKARYEAMQE